MATQRINDLKTSFIHWYFNEFLCSSEYLNMSIVKEDSPYHRERNVGYHTDMVIAQYLSLSQQVWTNVDIIGAFACAFHDTGKNRAEEECFSEERGNYRRYHGHELISARIWETFAIKNFAMLATNFNLDMFDIYRVGWIIEHHLPFNYKKDNKVAMLHYTIQQVCGYEVFNRCLLADCMGRIPDDYSTKLQSVKSWCEEMINESQTHIFKNCDNEDTPILYINVGASGSGKTTFTNRLLDANSLLQYFSLDKLRMDFYCTDDQMNTKAGYKHAFTASTEDKQFASKCDAEFMRMVKNQQDIIIDNTSTSAKSRRKYIDVARKKGYQIQCNLFINDINEVIKRQTIRCDKFVPEEAVRRQYDNTQYPSYGEFDIIKVFGPLSS